MSLRARCTILVPIFLFTCVASLLADDVTASGLTMKADVVITDSADTKTVLILLHILNASNHEITIVSKGLGFDHFQIDDDKSGLYKCTVGYTGRLDHDGHLVVPSLTDLSPITLRPNEEALVNYEWGDDDELAGLIKNKAEIEVTYSVDDLWAKRFGIWGGSVKAAAVAIVPFGDDKKSGSPAPKARWAINLEEPEGPTGRFANAEAKASF